MKKIFGICNPNIFKALMETKANKNEYYHLDKIDLHCAEAYKKDDFIVTDSNHEKLCLDKYSESEHKEIMTISQNIVFERNFNINFIIYRDLESYINRENFRGSSVNTLVKYAENKPLKDLLLDFEREALKVIGELMDLMCTSTNE